MPLPERVRVKVLPESAGYVSTTRVMQRDMTPAELMEALVAAAGKNVDRILHLLSTGSVVVGDYRYRWAPLVATRQEVEELLKVFPDPWPDRPFDPARCVHAVIRGGGQTVELNREQAARRRLLRRISFWDTLLQLAREQAPRYENYSYRQRADVYGVVPSEAQAERLREAGALLAIQGTSERVRRMPIESVQFLVNR